MSRIVFKDVCKTYDNKVEAVKNFNLEIEDEEFIVLVDPSGCGKSTVLRMLAGLEEISSGGVYIDGVQVNEIPPKDRDIGMVFQNYALYPHMTVYDNIAFSFTLQKVPKKEIEEKVRSVAKILNIESLLDRKPKQLSGGQRQRVALGRAIVRHPKAFLLDEPLSNLDAKLRAQTRAELIKLHNQLNTTFVYVTHDQTEAMTMADRIVVMRDGVVQQVDKPTNLYHKPANTFVAGFIGMPQINFVPVTVSPERNRLLIYEEEIGLSEVAQERLKLYAGEEMILGIRPEDFHIVPSGGWEAEIDFIEMMGSESLVYTHFYDRELVIRIPGEYIAPKGTKIQIIPNEAKIHMFDRETKKRIDIRHQVKR